MNKKSSANAGTSGGSSSQIPSIEERNKRIQQETMMEKLRAKHRNKPKSFDDLRKSLRMYYVEKNYPMDPVCKATLQSALDKLQIYIKVTSRHGLVERLESLSRQLGLKFMEDTSVLFISTDMFFIEILLDANGDLTDVKVHHECKIEQQSCSELVDCLKRGDFADFTEQLEGLSSIYQLNAEPKVKKKAFVALQAMETDIYNLYQIQNLTGNSYEMMEKSCVGLVLERRGGHPMKLTYFCPSVHINDEKPTISTLHLSVDQVMRSSVSLCATVNLEGSSANNLQIQPIVSFNRDEQTGLDMPVYAPLTQANSMLMPATYVLRLNKPLPVNYEALLALGLPQTSPGDGPSTSAASESLAQKPIVVSTIIPMMVQAATNNKITSTRKGLYVNLYNESHCYFFADNAKMKVTIISSLPFTDPSQVPKIITFLKQQALYYTLMSSCVREQQNHYSDMANTLVLDVTAVSFNQITLTMQHPYKEQLATLDFLISDDNVTCKLFSPNETYDELSEKITTIAQKMYSIPMVIYKLMHYFYEENVKRFRGLFGSGSGSGGFAGSSNNAGSGGGTASGSGIRRLPKLNLELGSSDPNAPGGLGGPIQFSGICELDIDAQVLTLADAFVQSNSTAAAIEAINTLKAETDPDAPTTSSAARIAALAAATAAAIAANKEYEARSQQPQQSVPKSTEDDIAEKYKKLWKEKTTNLKCCVSITPIIGDATAKPSTSQQMQPPQGTSLDVTRTGGIEIIPLSTQHPQQVVPGNIGASSIASSAPSSSPSSTTITITPITGASTGKEAKDKKISGTATPPGSSSSLSSAVTSIKRSMDTSSSNPSTSSDSQKEKKRKKKRDDSPMGPPEKVYSRQNSPAASSDVGSTAVVRKFSSPSSSPKGSSCGGLVTSVPPGSSLTARPSPKHSPVYSSPKHTTASNSPKSPFGTHSPKHGSSGKPSMSTLKSATASTSLSPKGEKSVGVVTSSIGPSTSTSALVRSFSSCSAGSGGIGVQSTSTMQSSAAATTTSALKRDKEKTSPTSTTSSSPAILPGPSGAGSTSAANTTAASTSSTALKTTLSVSALQQQQQQQQQQLKSVASLSHLAASGSMSGFSSHSATGTAAGAIELNSAMRKGMAGGAVSLMTSTVTTSATIITTTAAAAATTTVATAAGTTQQQQQLVPHSCGNSSGEGSLSSGGGNSSGSSSSSTEYMVKPSQEGLKLTINKTSSLRSSPSSSGSSSSLGKGKGNSGSGGTSSSSSQTSSSTGVTSTGTTTKVKQHTGLKPGVTSGPASKKASALASKNLKQGFQKSMSTSNLIVKISSSSSSASISSVAGGSGAVITKSSSTNTVSVELGSSRRRPSTGNTSASGNQRKSSGSASPAATAPTGAISHPPPRFDHHTDMMKILQSASPAKAANVEGFVKGLHTKFQIPKLSQRTTIAATTVTPSTSTTITPTYPVPTSTSIISAPPIETPSSSAKATSSSSATRTATSSYSAARTATSSSSATRTATSSSSVKRTATTAKVQTTKSEEQRSKSTSRMASSSSEVLPAAMTLVTSAKSAAPSSSSVAGSTKTTATIAPTIAALTSSTTTRTTATLCPSSSKTKVTAGTTKTTSVSASTVSSTSSLPATSRTRREAAEVESAAQTPANPADSTGETNKAEASSKIDEKRVSNVADE